MTESNEGLYLNTKPLADKAKKAVINDTTKKVAVAGAAGFATGFMTVLGTMAAQKMFEKLEERKQKKMLEKTEKEETEAYLKDDTYLNHFDQTRSEEVED